jgi:hypothetical protein
VFDAELSRALVERVQRLVVAVVADPHLGLDEHLSPIQAGAADTLADLSLVEVRRRGVYEAIAHAQRFDDRSRGHLRRSLEDTETERRHPHTVVQGHVHAHTPD